jgi:uncharacterized protein (TIGR02301 family)
MPSGTGTGWLGVAALVALAVATATPVLAATAVPAAPPAEAIVPPVPGGPPPYDEQLLRLSEILGAIHYLRQLCGSGEGNLWREQMQNLIDSEQPDAERRARFVDRFNRGYEGFRAVYRSCTPAATLAIDRYMTEGARITRDVAARYGKER